MSEPEVTIKQHYIALAKLLNNYRTSPFDQRVLKVTLAFCKNLYTTAKQHPDLVFAQPHLYKPQLSFVVNLAFNSTVLTCLLAVRNKFDPSVTIQLMCGSLSIFAVEQAAIEEYYQTDRYTDKLPVAIISKQNPNFVQLLKNHQQHVWLASYSLCSHIHLNGFPRSNLTNATTALAYFANKFALLCTPNKHPQTISFAQAFKHLSLKCCPRWYELLTPLLHYPGLSPPGSYIRLRDSSIHIVLTLNARGLVTKALPSQKSSKAQAHKTDIHLTLLTNVIHSFPTQQLKRFSRMRLWWGSDMQDWLLGENEQDKTPIFAPTLPMQSAPSSLLIIQDQLNQTNTDIAVIVKAIEKEPAYAHQLQVSASTSNRQKQSVQNIKHSLAMLGFERTNSILLQHSLLSRLNQQYFPLQQALLNFSHFFVLIAGTLAAKTKLISPELAQTTAYFVVSRLFTLGSIRSQTQWEPCTIDNFKVASLIAVKDNENLKNGALLLANAWQQNKQILEVLQHYDLVMQDQKTRSADQAFCFLLGISLALANEHYFSKNNTSMAKRTKNTASYLNTGLKELNINHADLTNIMHDIITNTKVYCQLP